MARTEAVPVATAARAAGLTTAVLAYAISQGRVEVEYVHGHPRVPQSVIAGLAESLRRPLPPHGSRGRYAPPHRCRCRPCLDGQNVRFREWYHRPDVIEGQRARQRVWQGAKRVRLRAEAAAAATATPADITKDS
jgi:hypothetical protein